MEGAVQGPSQAGYSEPYFQPPEPAFEPSPVQGPSQAGYQEPYFTPPPEPEPFAPSAVQGPSQADYQEPYFTPPPEEEPFSPWGPGPGVAMNAGLTLPSPFEFEGPGAAMGAGQRFQRPEPSPTAEDIVRGQWGPFGAGGHRFGLTDILDPAGGYAALQRAYRGEAEFDPNPRNWGGNIRENREQADWRASTQSLLPPQLLEKIPNEPWLPLRPAVEGLTSPLGIATIPIGGTFAGGVAKGLGRTGLAGLGAAYGAEGGGAVAEEVGLPEWVGQTAGGLAGGIGGWYGPEIGRAGARGLSGVARSIESPAVRAGDILAGEAGGGTLPDLPKPALNRVTGLFADAAEKEGRPRSGGIFDLIAPTETTEKGLTRLYEGKTGMAGLEVQRDVDLGNALLRQAGIKGTKVGPRLIVQDTPEVRQLFVALHGEGPVPPQFQAVYDDIQRLVKTETAATVAADPNFIPRDDYFYRGWRAPKETRPGAARVGATPGFKKPRVDATFTELLDEGWQPLSWNPYEMLAMRRGAGFQNRLQEDLVAGLKETGKALPKTEAPEGWRVPHVGPAFEGKPFAYTPGSKMASDPLARLAASEQAGARLGFTEQWAVPNSTANLIEAIFGRSPDLGAWDKLAKIPRTGKQAKLFGSLFQQVDFSTRTLGATTASVIEELAETMTKAVTLHPVQAAQRLYQAGKNLLQVPMEIAKLPIANLAPARRAALRDELLSGKALFKERPGITLKGVGNAGAKYGTDVSLVTRDFMKEISTGVKGAVPLRRLANINGAVQRGLFDGVYVQAQTTALKKLILPRLMRQHPDWTDAQIMAAGADQVNKMFSTLGEYQTVIQNPFVKKVSRDLIFSTNESEALIRGAFSTVTGPNKWLWTEYSLGVYLSLATTANLINYAVTGEWLDPEKLNPLEKGGYGPLPVGYRRDFLAPEFPLKGRGGTKATLDLVGQMDTVFRLLDPKSFVTSREALGPRAATTAYTQKDFFGRPLSGKETALQVASDIFEPIGLGQVRGLTGLGAENEARLGKVGQATQALGVNLRAETNAQVRDRIARESGLKKADGTPVTKWSDLEPRQIPEVKAMFPDLAEELTRRRDEAAGQGSEFAQRAIHAEEVTQTFVKAQETDDSKLASGELPPEKWRDQHAERGFGLRQRKEEIYASVSDPKATDALDKFYAILDRNSTDATIVKGTDWDKVDAEIAQLTPEEQDYIARNTGLGGTETEKRYRAETKAIADAGYFDLRGILWADFQKQMPETASFATFDDYRDSLDREIRSQLPPETAKVDADTFTDKFLSKQPVVKIFLKLYNASQTQWMADHPTEAAKAYDWQFIKQPTKLERLIIAGAGK